MALEPISELLTPSIVTGLVGLHVKQYQTPMRTLTRDIGMQQQLSYGATVPLPYAEEMVAQDRGALGSELTFPEPKGDKSTLKIDRNRVVTALIPDEIRSSITMPYINEHAREMATAVVNDYEKAIIAEIKAKASMSLTFSSIDPTTIKQVFLQAIEQMNDLGIPMADRWLVLNNASYSAILDWLTTIPFAKADNLLNTGIIGELFGLKLAVSSFADGIYFGHKNGLMRADSLQATDIKHSLERRSTLMASQNVYGLLAPRDGIWLGKVTVGTPPAPANPEQATTEKKKGFFNG